ncbi:MAG TPA: acyl-CoA dehydratase activase [Sedimentisphaerales bacterium]|nr:acyl-CoA dehydratase activase [Sedimentisphaerales bacterium]
MICAGIDAGSRAIKIVFMETGGKKVIAKGIRDQGVEQDRLTLELFERLLKEGGIKKRDIRRTVATGYGRDIVSLADTTITEITCHAVGVRHRAPEAMSVIDIGGQDSKVIRLDGSGKVRDFAMNDRCAAGTGRFLEVVASRLDADLESLGEMASKSNTPAAISSMCVVFAETEIIGLLASGTARRDIVAGVQKAVAARIAAMAGRNLDSPIVLTGGVARISGMLQALESALGKRVNAAPEPQMTGALGAVILACEQVNGGQV